MFFLVPKVAVILLIIFSLGTVFRRWRGLPRRQPAWIRLLGRRRPR